MANLTEEDKAKIAKFEKGLRKLYNELKRPDGTCDMTFPEFRKEFISLGDPNKLQADMEAMKIRKQMGVGAGVKLN
jgi:hypothetical protein